MSSRLLVKPLASSVSNDQILDYFKQSGFSPTEVQIMRDKQTKKSRGFCFVGFPTAKDAQDAIDKLYGSWMYGKKLNLALAKSIQPAAVQDTAPLSQTIKKRVADDAAVNEAISDLDYLQSRKRRKLDVSTEVTQEKPVLQRLFIKGLLSSASEDDLRQHLPAYGSIEAVSVPLSNKIGPDGFTKLNKGIAFIEFQDPAEAAQAKIELESQAFQGRNLSIRLVPSDKPLVSAKPTNGSKRVADQPAKDSLVLNQDAVLATTATRLGLSKSDILDPTSSSSAARLAIAETALIDETKSYFLDLGVDISAPRKGPRSKTTLLLKNLAGGTNDQTIRGLVAPYGTVKRLLVPPSGTLAAVEFAATDEADAAFSSLAYHKLGNSVVYVERPNAAFWDSAKDLLTPQAPQPLEPDEESPAQEGKPSSTLFVKNLSFKTRDSDFGKLFKDMPGYLFARIQPKKASDKTSQSAGYGFVGFRTTEQASQALQNMNGYRIDNHALNIQFAQSDIDDNKAGASPFLNADNLKAKNTTLVIKNVPFEANTKDLRELVSAFGTIKSLRMPKNANGRTRGFAFVDFPSKEEAGRAMQGLKHTHLYGRHLVMEVQTKASLASVLEQADAAREGDQT